MKKLPLKFDYTNLLAENIGSEGISILEIERFSEITKTYHKILTNDKESDKIGFYNLPFDKKLVKDINKFVKLNKDRFENFVVLGIGGSALGNIALLNSLKHTFHNFLPKKERKGLKIFILDNIDPEYVYNFLRTIDIKKTLFNVISKSGSTAETAAQFLIIVDLLKRKLKNKFTRNLVITTDEKNGDLRKIVDKYKINSFTIPENVGGRFSVLSSVGLLTAGFANIKIENLLKGAEDMLKKCQTEKLLENPAYLNATFHYLLDTQKKKNISVMFSYSNSLYYWADWYRQLWAESLGKNRNRNGEIIAIGQTPVKALGVTDQHSQVQLYTEGPNNKVFTFLQIEEFRNDTTIPKFRTNYSSLDYLSGHKLSELFNSEMKATEYAISSKGRPCCKIIFPKINEYTIGQFIMLYEIQTAFAGELYNIDAFNQPGVEAGKIATYGLLGREGYGDKAKEILTKDKDRKII
ncbi:MAG: glucose-6-phosphate isomerase [Ignavibacteriales bacterium]|nr:glucose-6-phosphate isomerase [Ignavibacteriales bacterium]